MAELGRQELESVQERVFLTLDATRTALDQVSTLLMVTQGGRASGPETRADGRRRWGGPLRPPGYPMGDQLRRARESIDELVAERATLLRTLSVLAQPLTALGVAAELARLHGWVVPTIDRVGTRASIPGLKVARTALAELATDLTALDGRLRIALIRLP